jgi:hypothetical protein
VILQKSGLEWFWRFLQEPRRMFRRYFIDDMAFFGLLGREMCMKQCKKVIAVGVSILVAVATVAEVVEG